MATTGESTHPSLFQRVLRLFRPSHEHSVFSASLMLVAAIMLSRVFGALRDVYVAWQFGAGGQTDAYVAAFTLPDFVNYLLSGGAVSITFITIYTRYFSEGQHEKARRTFSAIITMMTVVLGIAVIVGEIITPQFTRWFFPEFRPAEMQLCILLTRILLPAQIFFFLGTVMSAVLQSRRMFMLPAFAPVAYNIFIILGGILGARRFGVASLAIGAVAGCVLGPFLLNAVGALKTGIGYRVSFDWRDKGFQEWVKLSIPLMLGVSLVTADEWIIRHFASGSTGDITRLNYAKRLFSAPMGMLRQATGQASLPFFTSLIAAGEYKKFSRMVNDSVFRVGGISLLVTAWMCACSLPIIDLVYRRGEFTFSDSRTTAVYFFIFTISLFLWTAQGFYSRAFYAAGNTLVPMIAATAITVLSIPMYKFLFQSMGVPGLAVASDVGILVNTIVVALLLHQKKLVTFGQMRWTEWGKVFLVSLFAGVAAYAAGHHWHGSSRFGEFKAIAASTIVWAVVTLAGLWATRSELPGELRRRKKQPAATPTPEIGNSEELKP